MTVEIHINGKIVHSEAVTSADAIAMASMAADKYKLEVLRECGVDAFACISGVPSKMNQAGFEPEPADYDNHFK